MPTKTVKDACYETKTICFVIIHDVSYFVLNVPYYYVKGENNFYSLFLLFIIMLILI